jgi:hypothetical protein
MVPGRKFWLVGLKYRPRLSVPGPTDDRRPGPVEPISSPTDLTLDS